MAWRCPYFKVARLLNLWEFFGDVEKFAGVTEEEKEALGFGVG